MKYILPKNTFRAVYRPNTTFFFFFIWILNICWRKHKWLLLKIFPKGDWSGLYKIWKKGTFPVQNQKLVSTYFLPGRTLHWADWKEYKMGYNIYQLKQRTTTTIINLFLFCKSQIRCYCLKHSYQPLKES